MFHQIIHYSLHLLAPGIIAWFFFREKWLRAWGLMILTLLIDLDHLLATPVFDPCRCSINFHPLHSTIAIGLYLALLFPRATRVIAVGLLFHIATDAFDCFMMKLV
jgi:hypothetical protein